MKGHYVCQSDLIKPTLEIFEQKAKKNIILQSLSDLVTEKTNYLSIINSLKEEDKKKTNLIKLKPILPEKEKKYFGKVLPFQSFCKGFFLCSIPKEKAKIMENSNLNRSICGHLSCSKLPAMSPEIISKYPLKDTEELEINDDLASICFPSGIKICYVEDNRESYKTFFSPITNVKGNRLYMMIYHFYIKYKNNEYEKLYKSNSIQHFVTVLNKNKNKEDIEFLIEIKKRKYVFVPFCIALISQFPYINQMEKCLKKIHKIITCKPINNTNQNYINDIIVLLTRSIPIPLKKIKLSFQFPTYESYSKINSDILEDNITLYHKNHFKTTYRPLCHLFEFINTHNIIAVYNLLFLEEKILFIDKNYYRLSKIADIFLSLLYPFEWINPYISVLSGQLIDYLEAPLPFCMGIHEDLYKIHAKSVLTESKSDVYLVYIHKDEIVPLGKENDIKKDVITFPKEIYDKFNKELSALHEIIKESGNAKREEDVYWISVYIRYLFLECFSIMLYDIKDFLVSRSETEEIDIEKEKECLQKMLESRNPDDVKFYESVTSTQLFENFLQKISKNQRDYILFLTVLVDINNKKSKNEPLVRELKTINDVINVVTKSNFYGVLTMNTKIDLSLLINSTKEKMESSLSKSNYSKEISNYIQNINDKLYPSEDKIPKYLIPIIH